MKPILAAGAAAVIEEIARDRTFLAFDFDGTLAPIVDDRAAAYMREQTHDLLRATALLYPCAVISGRARADVAARVADIPLEAIIGNHGAEAGFGPLDRAFVARVQGWVAALRSELAATPGVEIEDKRFSVAVHYRRAPSRDDAERQVLAAVSRLDEARAFSGHAVVNVIPRDAPTKGDALRALCSRTRTNKVVYAGDDRTDEEAFRSDLVAISIRVGESSESAATYFVPGQDDVDELLRRLIEARARIDGLGDRWRSIVQAVKS